MNVVNQTTVFAEWLAGLVDARGKGLILARIEAAKLGNFGDAEPVGDGVSEMRIHFGPGYRVYYMREGNVLYLLLCGGDKSSQTTDIRNALSMASEVREAARAAAIAAAKTAAKALKAAGQSKSKSKASVKAKSKSKSSEKTRKG